MSCLKDNTPLITLLGAAITKILLDKSKAGEPIMVNQIVKEVYDNFKKRNASEELAMDAARSTPIIMFRVTANHQNITEELEKTTPDILTDIINLRKAFLKDDDNFTALKEILGIKDANKAELFETEKKASTIVKSVKKAIIKTGEFLTAIKTYAQEFINYDNPEHPDFLKMKPQFVRSSWTRSLVNIALSQQIISDDIKDSSELKLNGLSKPGVYLRIMKDDVAVKKYKEAFEGLNPQFFVGEDLIGILVDSEGKAINFGKDGKVNAMGSPSWYLVESDALRLNNGSLVTSKAAFDKYMEEFKETNKFKSLTPAAQKTVSDIKKAIYNRFQNRVIELTKKKLPEDISKMSSKDFKQLEQDTINDLDRYYQQIDQYRTFLIENEDDYIDNVLLKNDESFVVSNMYKPTPLSKIVLPGNGKLGISVQTKEQVADSEFTKSNTYTTYPNVTAPITILRTPISEKENILEDIVSFFTDVLYERLGTTVTQMELPSRLEYIKQFVVPDILGVQFNYEKNEETGETNYLYKKADGTEYYKLSIGNFQPVEIKFDNSKEDNDARKFAASLIRTHLKSGFVKFDPQSTTPISANREYNTDNKEGRFTAKQVLEKAKQDGAKIVLGQPAEENEEMADAIARQVKNLEARTIFGFPTGSKEEGKEYEYFMVYRPTLNVVDKLVDSNYNAVESKTPYENGSIINFKEQDYNDFVIDNFSTNALVNNEGKPVQVRTQFSFVPTLSEIERIEKAMELELEIPGAEEKVEEAVEKDPMTTDNGDKVNPVNLLDRFNNNKFFEKSKAQRDVEVAANNKQLLKALIWYSGSTAAAKDPEFKSLYNKLSAADKAEINRELKEARTIAHPLAKFFPFKVLFRAINTQGSHPSAQWAVDGMTLFSYYKKSKSEASQINFTDLYHEAWHGFTQTFLTPEERDELYKEASKKEGSFRDFNGRYVTFASATKKQLDEFLAEDYRLYMMNGGKVSDAKAPVKNGIFRKMLNFFKYLFGKSDVSQFVLDPKSFPKIHKIYEKLSIGDLSGYNFNTQNIDQTMGTFERSILSRDPNAKLTELGYQDAANVIETIDSILSNLATQLNKQYSEIKKRNITSYTTQLMKDSEDAAAAYAYVKEKFKTDILNSLNKRIAGDVGEYIKIALKGQDVIANDDQIKTLAEAVKLDENKNRTISIEAIKNLFNLSAVQLADAHAAILTELASIDNTHTLNQLEQAKLAAEWVIDNFGDTENLAKNLDGKGVIAYHLKKSKYISNDDKELSFDNEDTKVNRQYDDASNKISQYDDADADVHYVLGAINKYDDKNKPVINIFGEQSLEDEYTVWNRVARILHGSLDPVEMYERMLEGIGSGANTDYIIKQVVEKLGPPSPIMTSSSASLWINFFHTFSMYNNPLFQMNIENMQNGNFDVVVGSVSSVQRKVKQIWNNKFRNAEGKHFRKNMDRDTDPSHYKSVYLDVVSVLTDKSLGNGTSINEGAAFDFFNAIGVILSNKENIKNEVNKQKNPVGSAPQIYVKLRGMLEKGIDKIYSLDQIFDETPGTEASPTPLANENTNFNNLAELETRNSDYTSNYIVTNAANNTQFELTKHSSLSVTISTLNNAKSLRSMLDQNKHMSKFNPLTNPAAATSMELNSLFDVQDFILGGEGKRREHKGNIVSYKTGNVAGLRYIDEINGDVGVETAKLDSYSKLVFDFHTSNIVGRMEFITPADKGTRLSSWLTHIEGGSSDGKFYVDPISLYETANGTVKGYYKAAKIMTGYLESEMKRITNLMQLNEKIKALPDGEYIEYDADYLKQGQDFIIFEDIIPEKYRLALKGYNSIEEYELATNKSVRNEIESEIVRYLTNQFEQVKNAFNEAPFISKELLSQTSAKAAKANYSISNQKSTDALIRSLVVNNWIHNYESIVVIFGDPAQYNLKKEEVHKRDAGAQSVKTIPITNDIFIQYVNNKTKSGYNDKGEFVLGSYAKSLNDPSIVETGLSSSGQINAAVLEDSVVDSKYLPEIKKGLLDNEMRVNKFKMDRMGKEEREDYIKRLESIIDANISPLYNKMKEGDGQGWISFDFYRRVSILLGIWTPTQEQMFKKIINKEEFDVDNVSQFFPVLKLQYWGDIFTGKNLPLNGFHKFSLMPLVPPVIENTKLNDLHMKMMKDGIDYALFKSGSKISTITKINNKGEAVQDKFYLDKERSINNTSVPFTKNTVFLQYLGNQLKIAPEFKEEVTFPSQMRKIIERGIFLDGAPKDFMEDALPSTRREEWENLTEDEKIKNSKFYQKIANYEKYINALSKFKLKKLKEDLGVDGDKLQLKDGNVVMTEKLKTFLVNQLESQDLGDHEIDFIKQANGTLANDLSISLSAEKLDKVLNSIVVRKLIKQKLNGEALAQVSTSGFENVLRGRLTEEEIALYNPTNDLPYYGYDKGPDGETSAAKCKIALQGPFKALLNLEHNDGQPIRTRLRLNDMIRNEEWLNKGNNRDMITIIGPRIPTQENNSVEFLEVWEFLPEIAGSIVVLPSEIVAKSGGDFDIDKITFMFPQLVTKKDMTFWATLEGDRELKRLAVDNLKYATKLNYFNVNDIIYRKGQGEELNKDEKAIYNIVKKATEEFDTEYPLDETSEKGITNNLIRSMKELLNLKVMYASLVTPNSTNILEPLAKDILSEHVIKYNPKARFQEGGDTSRISGTKIFEILYNLYKHSSNNIGKDILGIIAVANNYSALFNRIGFYMNATYGEGKRKRSQYLALQHNWAKDKNGKNVISLSGTHDANNEYSIATIINQLLNGSVDVAKDAWIFFLQTYKETISTVLWMVKTGVPVRQAVYMVTHPLVRAYIKERQLLSSPMAVPLGLIPEGSEDLPIKRLAMANILSKSEYGINFPPELIYSKGASKGRYDLVTKLLFEQGPVKDMFNKFDIEKNLLNKVKDKNYKTEDFDVAVFLHYLQIEEMSEAVTDLIQKTTFDTNPSLSIFDAANKKYDLDELRANGRYPAEFVNKLINESPIGSFNIQDFQANLWQPLMKLRHNPTVIDFFVKAARNNRLAKVAKINGISKNEIGNLVSQFLNDIPNFVLQNHINSFNLDKDSEFKGLSIESAAPLKKKSGLTFSVQVAQKDGEFVIYVDREQLRNEYHQLATKGSFDKSVIYNEVDADNQLKPVTKLQVELASVNKAQFPNEQSYYRFVIEREILRALYPGKTGFEELLKREDVKKKFDEYEKALRESKPESEPEEVFMDRAKSFTYEVVLRNMALDNSYNMHKLFLSSESMADQYDAIKNLYPELEKRYPVIKNFEASYKEDIPGTIRKVSNIVLSDILLNGDKINVYNQNLRELANPAMIKLDTDNKVERRRVADFFNRLSVYAFLQSGQNAVGMFGLVRVMPQERYLAIIKPLLEKFEKNVNNISLERFLTAALRLYSNPNLKTRYKNWTINSFNVEGDAVAAKGIDFTDTFSVRAIASDIIGTYEVAQDENGNYLYDSTTNEDGIVDQIINAALQLGNVVGMTNTIKLKEEIAPKPTAKIKPGVEELFDSNPELADSVYEALGFFKSKEQKFETPEEFEKRTGRRMKMSEYMEDITPDYTEITDAQYQQALQLYSQYLDTVFPDSQLKDIVYRNESKKKGSIFNNFRKGKENTNFDIGFYFTTKKGALDWQGWNQIQIDEQELNNEFDNKIFAYVLNTKNPKKESFKQYFENNLEEGFKFFKADVNKAIKENYDALIAIDVKDISNEDQFIVFESEQIHILGSKQDVEGFKEFASEATTQSITGFQGYKGGFEDKDKGTSKGDGKDKAMRQVADGYIGEIAEWADEDSVYWTSNEKYKPKTSSSTSALKIAKKNGVGVEDIRNNTTVVTPNYDAKNLIYEFPEESGEEIIRNARIMLSRNSEFKGQPLKSETKKVILDNFNKGAEFVVGDMPDVDSQFIDYLQEIGAKFTVYHTGSTPRIQINQVTTQSSVAENQTSGLSDVSTDDSNPFINPLAPKKISIDKATATAESMRSQVDDLINYYIEAREDGATVIFPSEGVGQDLIDIDPATGEINPETSPLAYQTFLYLSEQLAKHFNYTNPGFVQAVSEEGVAQEKPADEDEIEFTEDDFKNLFILFDCLFTNS